jgi:hypothetical protein
MLRCHVYNNVLFPSKLSTVLITVPFEEVSCFSRGETRLALEHEGFQGRFRGLFAVEDGGAVVHLGPPKALMVGAAADEIFAGNVGSVMIE